MTTPIWTPNAARIENANITKFCNSLNERDVGTFTNYDDLWNWSVDDLEGFWSAVWDFCDIRGEKGQRVLENPENLLEAQFFPDAKINFAENILREEFTGSSIIFHSELGARVEWSWDELRQTVSRLQQALRDKGVQKGDRVAGVVPNTPQTIAAMLAVTSLGAVWCSCSPDFGFDAAMDRISQVEPKILFCADGYTYNGKEISCVDTIANLGEALPSIDAVVVFTLSSQKIDIDKFGKKSMSWDQFMGDFEPDRLTYERVAFYAPLYIMFSSGTTGLPKCIVHSVGGTTIQHFKEHQLQADLKVNDRMLYFTTCGWMMWNWMVSALGTGASVVLFDGSPFYPDGYRLADIVAQESVTHFGTSAKYIDACSKAEIAPKDSHDFSKLRTILSTGSPLADAGFEYIYKDWKKDLCLSSIAGGTDIIACFVGGSPISPVYKGECQKRHLGMDVHVFDDEANNIVEKRGELVCTSPHPSMPVGFWNDDNDTRYKSAYFETFDNVWHQGDFVELTQNKGLRFYGRSDAVLNPGGVRIGTAEIYRIVEAMDEIIEGVVIGQVIDNDQHVVLFVRLQDGYKLNDGLVQKIKTTIRANATPRHVPAIVLKVDDIPRTKSGKIAEIAVRDTIDGKEIKNSASLANPEAISLYKNIPELKV